MAIEDLSGKRFGRLLVLERDTEAEKTKVYAGGTKKVLWKCICDCGTEHTVAGDTLKKGASKSCGCLQKELLSERVKKYNTYDLSGEYGICFDDKGNKILFDLEDYDKIKDYYWHPKNTGKDDNRPYVVANITDQKHTLLHRFVLNLNDNTLVVDHLNHNVLDNRKANLRITTRAQNNQNRTINKNNTTGIAGISYRKDRDRYVARIQINHKSVTLGYFHTLEEAAQARKKAEEKYFGEYSYSNSMKQAQNKGLINELLNTT